VSLTLWRDISVVWLFLLCFIGMLIPLALSFFAVWGMHKALQQARTVLTTAQSVSSTVREKAGTASEQVVRPVIGAQRLATRASESLRVLTGARRR